VVKRYFSSSNEERIYHQKLVDFFMKKTLNSRKLIEYPYHLKTLEDKQKMKEFLTDIAVFNAFYNDFDKYDLFTYWRVIGGQF
jgi:hypothetical protein